MSHALAEGKREREIRGLRMSTIITGRGMECKCDAMRW